MSNRPIIIVLEDDPVQLKIAVSILQFNQSYEVKGFSETASAMEYAEHTIPDLIISDNYMEGETGIEFCRRIKEHPVLRKTMFMLLTAERDVAHKVQALDLGADDYINKPYHPDEFLSRVRVLLRMKELQDELEFDRDKLRKANEILNQNLDGMVNLLSKLVTMRIPNASARGAEAARVCRWMSERLGIDYERCVLLELAARFHEIGKAALTDDLLRFQGELNFEQKKRLAEFPLFSESLLTGIQQFGPVARWLRHQMENYDGTGYPDKVRGEEIPLEARLLRAVNFYESMSTEILDHQELLEDQLMRARNTILDPRIVQLLREYIELERHPSWLNGKQQISVLDLREGMTIAADVSTGSGKKLLVKDSHITQTMVERILAQHHFDPIISGVYIYDVPSHKQKDPAVP